MQKQKKLKSFISIILSFAVGTTVIFSPFGTNLPNKTYAATPDNISISENGLQFIIDREGFSSTCFWDYAQWTIGYGTRCTETNHPANPSNLQKGSHTISKSEAKSRFLSALESTYIPGVRRRLSGVDMNQNQFDALVSLCYNAGEGKLANSPFAKYLRGEITKDQAYSDYCSYVITAGGKVNQGLINRRKLEADLFFKGIDDDIIDPPIKHEGCFSPCGSGYTSIVEALKSIGVDSSMTYRKQIAAANGISGYSGTAEQNTQMLNMLKAGTLKVPNGENPVVPEEPPIVEYDASYFPKCSSSFTSIVDALKSIGVDSSMSNRKVIASANGISGYSGTSDQNTQMLNLLKSGQLKNPNGTTTTPDTSGKYFPACSSGATSLVDALKSVGVDSSMDNRKTIAAANGISGYSGTASQNTQMLNLLKSGQLVNPSYAAPPAIVNYNITLNANGGYTPVDSLSVASNSTYKGLPVASREGYTFNGWFTSVDGGSQVTDGNGLVSASDHTLYAHWSANQYSVSFDNNDGSGITSTKKVVYGGNYGELPVPTRTGYTFAGWYTTYTDAENSVLITSNSKYSLADNQTLFARWKTNQYTVSFDSNGSSDTVENKTVEYDSAYGVLPDIERKGYSFDGWYTDKTNGEEVTEITRVSITSNQTLYAHWTKLPEKESLKLSETQITMINGEQYVVKANQENLTYKSSNSDVAVVSKSGIITAVGIGTATISVINSDFDVAQLKVTVSPVYIEGDCNNDGEFTISDAVTLQKWLLAVPDTNLANWKAADLCEDGVINVFDLCVMKKKLINKK